MSVWWREMSEWESVVLCEGPHNGARAPGLPEEVVVRAEQQGNSPAACAIAWTRCYACDTRMYLLYVYIYIKVLHWFTQMLSMLRQDSYAIGNYWFFSDSLVIIVIIITVIIGKVPVFFLHVHSDLNTCLFIFMCLFIFAPVRWQVILARDPVTLES